MLHVTYRGDGLLYRHLILLLYSAVQQVSCHVYLSDSNQVISIFVFPAT